MVNRVAHAYMHRPWTRITKAKSGASYLPTSATLNAGPCAVVQLASFQNPIASYSLNHTSICMHNTILSSPRNMINGVHMSAPSQHRITTPGAVAAAYRKWLDQHQHVLPKKQVQKFRHRHPYDSDGLGSMRHLCTHTYRSIALRLEYRLERMSHPTC